MDSPILEGFTPAPNFGISVRKKIEQILNRHIEELNTISKRAGAPQVQSTTPTLAEILFKLQKLESSISDLKKPAIEGMGHNNPPSPIEDNFWEDKEAKDSIEIIRNELLSESFDKQKIEKNQKVLIKLGFQLAAWTKERATDFSTAASKVAGASFGLWITGLGSQIVDTVKALTLYLAG